MSILNGDVYDGKSHAMTIAGVPVRVDDQLPDNVMVVENGGKVAGAIVNIGHATKERTCETCAKSRPYCGVIDAPDGPCLAWRPRPAALHGDHEDKVIETAWLIEMPMTTFGGPPCWWTGNYKTGALTDQWSNDSLMAVRFSRKEDAEAVIRGTLRLEGKGPIATEHQWSGEPHKERV